MKSLIHLNSNQTSKKSELLGNVKNLREDSRIKLEDIQIVVNSDAVEIARKGSRAAEYIREDMEKGVNFKICSNSIENRDDIDENDLIEGVELVESGVGTINLLQEEGYNYTKI